MSYNEDENYGHDERFSDRRPYRPLYRKDFHDRPRTEVQVKLNGPHTAYTDIVCDGGCGKTILRDETFYFVNLLGTDRAQKMCPNCTKSKIA